MEWTELFGELGKIGFLIILASWVFKVNTIVKHLEDIKTLLENQSDQRKEKKEEGKSDS